MLVSPVSPWRTLMPTRRKPDPDRAGSNAARIALGAGMVAAAGAAFLLNRKSKDHMMTDAMVSEAPPWTFKTNPKATRES